MAAGVCLSAGVPTEERPGSEGAVVRELPRSCVCLVFKMTDVAGRQRGIFPLPLISAPFTDHCMHKSRSARKKRSQKFMMLGVPMRP